MPLKLSWLRWLGLLSLPILARQDQTLTLTVGSEQVPYTIIKQADKPDAPLLIGLHGYGMDEYQMQTLVNPNLAFDCHYIAIRGFQEIGPGEFGWFTVWDEGGHPAYDQAQVAASLEKLDQAIKAAIAQFEALQIFLIGYSQGAGMALNYAWQANEKVIGIAAFAGFLTHQVDGPVKEGLPVFIGHGAFDALIDSATIEDSRNRLEKAGARVLLNTYTVPHVVSAQGRRDMASWLKTILDK